MVPQFNRCYRLIYFKTWRRERVFVDICILDTSMISCLSQAWWVVNVEEDSWQKSNHSSSTCQNLSVMHHCINLHPQKAIYRSFRLKHRFSTPIQPSSRFQKIPRMPLLFNQPFRNFTITSLTAFPITATESKQTQSLPHAVTLTLTHDSLSNTISAEALRCGDARATVCPTWAESVVDTASYCSASFASTISDPIRVVCFAWDVLPFRCVVWVGLRVLVRNWVLGFRVIASHHVE